MPELDDHRICGWRWQTATATTISWHECASPHSHAMEHRCTCGKLYPA